MAKHSSPTPFLWQHILQLSTQAEEKSKEFKEGSFDQKYFHEYSKICSRNCSELRNRMAYELCEKFGSVFVRGYEAEKDYSIYRTSEEIDNALNEVL